MSSPSASANSNKNLQRSRTVLPKIRPATNAAMKPLPPMISAPAKDSTATPSTAGPSYDSTIQPEFTARSTSFALTQPTRMPATGEIDPRGVGEQHEDEGGLSQSVDEAVADVEVGDAKAGADPAGDFVRAKTIACGETHGCTRFRFSGDAANTPRVTGM